MKYRIDLDSFMDDLFHELESASDEGKSHEVVIKASDEVEATEILMRKIQVFIDESWEELE